MSTTFMQLWLYNNWANTALLDKLKSEGENVPHSCIRLFSHIVNAQIIWLSRLTVKNHLLVFGMSTVSSIAKGITI